MEENIITNQTLYDFLKGFKGDFTEFKRDVYKRFDQVDKRFDQVDKRFEQVDKRFEQVDKRFEQVEKRFDQADKRFEQLEGNYTEDHKLIIDLWANRSKSTLNFSSVYFIITLTSSILAAIATISLSN